MHRLVTARQAGLILSTRRKLLGLSQSAVAAGLGISQNRLSELETHPERLTLERLISLAGLLGLELVLRDKASGDTSHDGPAGSEW